MGFFDSIKEGISLFFGDIEKGFIDGIKLFLVNLLLAVPFVGAFLYPGYFIKVVRGIAEDFDLTVGSMNEEEAKKIVFKVISLPNIILWIALLLALLSAGAFVSVAKSMVSGGGMSILENLSFGTLLLALIILFGVAVYALIMALLYLYTMYALIIGKYSSIERNVKGSIVIIALSAILGILLEIIIVPLGFIPIVGEILVFILGAFVFPIIQNLAVMHYIKTS